MVLDLLTDWLRGLQVIDWGRTVWRIGWVTLWCLIVYLICLLTCWRTGDWVGNRLVSDWPTDLLTELACTLSAVWPVKLLTGSLYDWVTHSMASDWRVTCRLAGWLFDWLVIRIVTVVIWLGLIASMLVDWLPGKGVADCRLNYWLTGWLIVLLKDVIVAESCDWFSDWPTELLIPDWLTDGLTSLLTN